MSGSPFRTLAPANHQLNRDAAWRSVGFLACAALVATGAIHLDLYLTGYQTIPTIGWLFLLQVISAFVLAFAVAVSGHRLFAAAGAGFSMTTLIGYLVALRVSLFGFREVRTSAGIVAGAIEIIGFTALASIALRPNGRSSTPSGPRREHRTIVNQRVATLAGRWVVGVLSVQAAVSLGLLVSNADVPVAPGGRSVVVKVAEVHGVAVLTNAHGYTLYWFAPDTSNASHCYGTCAAYWPPVIGTPTAGTGVTGSLTTLRRKSGAPQVAFDGHPLYTYVGDSSPGQATGNRVRLNGGWWYEMRASN